MEKHQKNEHGEKQEEYDIAAGSNGDLNGDVQQPPKKRFKTEVIDPTLEEDQRFLCDQCDYTAKRLAHLKAYIFSRIIIRMDIYNNISFLYKNLVGQNGNLMIFGQKNENSLITFLEPYPSRLRQGNSLENIYISV